MDEDRVRAAFRDQAAWCRRLGSPFTARLLDRLAADLDRTTLTGRRVLHWLGDPGATGDALPLRLAGALHAHVRAGTAGPLAAVYPPNEDAEDNGFSQAFRQEIAVADAALAAWLDRPPQTNEVARSAVLYPGLMAVAMRTGLPLALHEIGASAGLNLLPDRYGYVLGTRRLGPPDAVVRLAPEWTGPDPAGDPPRILSRRGCDIAPLDAGSAADRARLLAYVWADQTERLARIEASLGLAAEERPVVDPADAADWAEAVLACSTEAGVTRVLMHSITLQYLDPQARARIVAAVEAAGRRASAAAPLAWLSFEADAGSHRLRLRLWPGDHDLHLADADPHGRSVAWLAG